MTEYPCGCRFQKPMVIMCDQHWPILDTAISLGDMGTDYIDAMMPDEEHE